MAQPDYLLHEHHQLDYASCCRQCLLMSFALGTCTSGFFERNLELLVLRRADGMGDLSIYPIPTAHDEEPADHRPVDF